MISGLAPPSIGAKKNPAVMHDRSGLRRALDPRGEEPPAERGARCRVHSRARPAPITLSPARENVPPDPNPFAVLSLIVAPAILTNASSVLIMSTSNRLARAVDRARELSKQLESSSETTEADPERRLRELSAAETRALLLLRALRRYYTALGGFASAALLSLLGAVLIPLGLTPAIPVFEILAVTAGLVAVGALVNGSVILVRETRIAVQVLQQRAARIRERVAELSA